MPQLRLAELLDLEPADGVFAAPKKSSVKELSLPLELLGLKAAKKKVDPFASERARAEERFAVVVAAGLERVGRLVAKRLRQEAAVKEFFGSAFSGSSVMGEKAQRRDSIGRYASGGGSGGIAWEADAGKAYPKAPKPKEATDEQVSDLKTALRSSKRGDGDRVNLYHVTTADRANEITEKGLVPGAEKASGQAWKAEHSDYATYFHSSPEGAVSNWRESGRGDNGKPNAAIIRVSVPVNKKSLRRILPDEDFSSNIDDGIKALIRGDAVALIGGSPSSSTFLQTVREGRVDSFGSIKEFGQKALADIPRDQDFWGLAAEEFYKGGEISGEIDTLLADGWNQASRLGLGVNYNLVNEAVYGYSRQYTDEWWQGLESTTRDALRDNIEQHIASGEPLKNLTARLADTVFSPKRAEMIAATEVTRLYAEGNRQAYASAGIETVEWMNVEDIRVCPTCDDLDEQQWPLGKETMVPPAHVRCRCRLSPIVDDKPVEEEAEFDLFADDPEWLTEGKLDPKTVEPLGASGGVSDTYWAEVGGRKVLAKTSDPFGDPRNERAAVLVNRAMGSPNNMPNAVYRRPEWSGPRIRRTPPDFSRGSEMAIMEFRSGKTAHEHGGGLGHLKGVVFSEEEYRNGAIFDNVVANIDRHERNYMIEDGAVQGKRLLLIDHSIGFGERHSFTGSDFGLMVRTDFQDVQTREIRAGRSNSEAYDIAEKEVYSLRPNERVQLQSLMNNRSVLEKELVQLMSPQKVEWMFDRAQAILGSGDIRGLD